MRAGLLRQKCAPPRRGQVHSRPDRTRSRLAALPGRRYAESQRRGRELQRPRCSAGAPDLPSGAGSSHIYCHILVLPVPERTMAIETEIKFRVDDLDGLAQKLQSAGFRCETPRTFESNVLYDTPDRQL